MGRKLALESLEPRRLLAIDFDLLKDVNATLNAEGSIPVNIVEVGSVAFFTATTPTHGRDSRLGGRFLQGRRKILVGRNEDESRWKSPWRLTHSPTTFGRTTNSSVIQ